MNANAEFAERPLKPTSLALYFADRIRNVAHDVSGQRPTNGSQRNRNNLDKIGVIRGVNTNGKFIY